MRRWTAVAVVLLAAFAAASVKLFAFPDEELPPRADAVVVLAGQWELRLPLGQQLVEEGLAPELALSEDSDDEWPRALCRRRNVTCFQADPYSTYGEAATFREVARRHGWRTVVVVTSDYHATRARLLFDRCLDGTVYAAGADESFGDWLHGTAWEWPKLLHALTVKRGC